MIDGSEDGNMGVTCNFITLQVRGMDVLERVMTSSAERQRRRRQRLRKQGIVDVTVAVPEADKGLLRSFARRLARGEAPLLTGSRLLDIVGVLKGIGEELRKMGVVHAGVFGSTARGRDTRESDADIVIDIDQDRIGDVLDLVAVAGRIERAVQSRCPGVRVEVADLNMLKRTVREDVEKEAVYAF